MICLLQEAYRRRPYLCSRQIYALFGLSFVNNESHRVVHLHSPFSWRHQNVLGDFSEHIFDRINPILQCVNDRCATLKVLSYHLFQPSMLLLHHGAFCHPSWPSVILWQTGIFFFRRPCLLNKFIPQRSLCQSFLSDRQPQLTSSNFTNCIFTIIVKLESVHFLSQLSRFSLVD